VSSLFGRIAEPEMDVFFKMIENGKLEKLWEEAIMASNM
jgi:hypothetical protein